MWSSTQPRFLSSATVREPADHVDHESVQSDRPLGAIVRQPVFLAAVFGGVVAYGVMTLIMTATPLSMYINDGFSIDGTLFTTSFASR